VRGDAIAGLLVVLINVIGGMVIGIVQQGLTFAEAAHTYTLLTVGDGLVTQVPALIVSTAARRRACWRSRKSIRAPGSRPWPASEAFPRSGRARRSARWPQFVFPNNDLWLVPARRPEPRRNQDATHPLSRLFKVQ
jgi:hypothetical protein